MKYSIRGIVIMASEPCVPPAKWDYYSSGGTIGTFGTPEVKDPVQGKYLNNCSLIAAFASLAWKGKIGAQPQDPRITTYTFQFYNPNKQQKADGKTPLDANAKLMHAKSDTTTEIWPALYEKAYYMWLDKIDAADGRPNYCKYIGWQSPETVLPQLTGVGVKKKLCLNQSSDNVFSDINDNLCTNFNPVVTNRTLLYPAVAWTYDSRVYNPNGAVYSDTTIVSQHTYSLLGVTGTKAGTVWTSKYIVLRNPYGMGKGDPAITLPFLNEHFFTGAWCGFNLGIADGIFALRADQFVKYFEAYAWV
jgi:hypothetical protein